MMSAPETVTSDLSLESLVEDYFLHRRYQAFPVTDNGDLRGIISLNQVKEIPREKWHEQTVAQTMTPINDLVTVRLETPMTQVLEKMEDSGIKRVLVTHEGQLDGIITAGDVSSWLRRMRELKRI